MGNVGNGKYRYLRLKKNGEKVKSLQRNDYFEMYLIMYFSTITEYYYSVTVAGPSGGWSFGNSSSRMALTFQPGFGVLHEA